MTQTPGSPSDEMKAKAREAIDELPAETALGNKDPQGGGTSTPEEYEAAHGAGHESGQGE
jgi:hypothetical protein